MKALVSICQLDQVAALFGRNGIGRVGQSLLYGFDTALEFLDADAADTNFHFAFSELADFFCFSELGLPLGAVFHQLQFALVGGYRLLRVVELIAALLLGGRV